MDKHDNKMDVKRPVKIHSSFQQQVKLFLKQSVYKDRYMTPHLSYKGESHKREREKERGEMREESDTYLVCSRAQRSLLQPVMKF